MNHLSACPSCERHVRVSESACPFCRAPLDDAFRARPALRRPARRLGRAALFTFATTTAIAGGVGACADEMTQDIYGGPPPDGGDDGQSQAVYGGPALDAAPTPAPAYGGPPVTLDASDDGGDASDGSDQ